MDYKTRCKVTIVVFIYLLLAITVSLSGCTTQQPTAFKTGAPVPPPQGCIDGRARGVDC